MKNLLLLLLFFPAISFADTTFVTECPVEIVEVEVIKYVEVTEYVEIEVPVYLDFETNSRAVYEVNSAMLYLYDIEVWDGPVLIDDSISEAVLKYELFDDRNMFDLIKLEE